MEQELEQKLRPCPLCGEKPETSEEYEWIIVTCNKHLIECHPTYMGSCYVNDDIIVDGWNEECDKWAREMTKLLFHGKESKNWIKRLILSGMADEVMRESKPAKLLKETAGD